MHITSTTTADTTATTKTKGIKVKLSGTFAGDFDLNQNTVSVYKLRKACITNVPVTALRGKLNQSEGIMCKLLYCYFSWNAEGNVEDNKYMKELIRMLRGIFY